MSDILSDVTGFLAKINVAEIEEIFDQDPWTIYNMLSRAADEIERLRKRNVELGWIENPDRSGGQFTDEELNRSGWL